MKLLFVCRFLPHPQVRDSGGQDVYHYIASLSQAHEVSLIAFVTPDQARAVAAMEAVCREVVAVPYRPGALAGRVWRAGWRVLRPSVYGRVVSPAYGRALRRLVAGQRFDVAVVDGMMAGYGRLLGRVPRVLDEIDLYSLVAYQAYAGQPPGWRRRWARRDWLRTLAFELDYVREYAGVLVRSAADEAFLRAYGLPRPVAVVAPWFEGLESLQSIPPVRPPGDGLLFMGAMNHQKNIAAVQFFVTEVLPLVRQQVPAATLTVVGGNPAGAVQALAQQPGVVVTGEVPDLTPYYAACAVNVVPLLTGGGIIVKTLNGLAAGRPTVSTPLGNAGTGARPGQELLVVPPEPAALAEAVVQVLTDPALWQRLATAGRQFVGQQYDWPANMARLVAFLAGVAGESSVNRPE